MAGDLPLLPTPFHAFVIFFQGNVGDSRAIASVKGKVQQLSYDHKPSNEGETKRIIAAGGWVEFNRVNGMFVPHFYMRSLLACQPFREDKGYCP